MIQHGLISNLDAETIEATLNLVCDQFPDDDFIFVTEVGIFNGATSVGMYEYLESKGKVPAPTAIDNENDKPVQKPTEYCTLIIGNSMEVYNELDDNSQHFIFIDANHSFPMAIADFFCYESKVKTGGYLAFHDTGLHIKDFTDYQGIGKTHDKDMYISVRKALKKIGLLDDKFEGWKLVFDKADETDRAGGIVVLKRLA